MTKLHSNQSVTRRREICYGCGFDIVEHTPNSNTWRHDEYEDCCGPVRPKVEDNDRPMNWQADETALEYKARKKHYYDGVFLDDIQEEQEEDVI